MQFFVGNIMGPSNILDGSKGFTIQTINPLYQGLHKGPYFCCIEENGRDQHTVDVCLLGDRTVVPNVLP